ncbi:MAG: glycoside hydrolase family 5 protein [Shimia sp.]
MGHTLSWGLALCQTLVATAAFTFPVERCINLGAALEAPSEGDWGYTIRRADITRIAEAGFDTIRLPARFSGHWDGTIDPAFLSRVDEVIGWASAEDLTVILDLHHFWPLFDAPEDPALRAKARAIWAELSEHYADAPNTLIFELLNEPEPPMTHAQAWAVQAELRAIIRERHPTRWIITGASDWNDWEGLAALPAPDPNEVRTFHFYAPFDFTHQGAPYIDPIRPPATWGSAADRAALAAEFDRIAALKLPLFLGEFGTYDAAPRADAAAWTSAVREAAEARGIAWCYWGFTQGTQDGFQAYDTEGEAWRPGILEALTPQQE